MTTLSLQEGRAGEASRFIASYPDLAEEIARQIARRQPVSKVGGLTERQLQLLVFIRSYIGENGISPSFDEMKDATGQASKSGIHRLVTALEERGFIERLPCRARAIVLRSRQ